jgi:hypothetical protein
MPKITVEQINIMPTSNFLLTANRKLQNLFFNMMKSLLKNHKLFSAFLITGVLSISTSLSLGQNATANTQKKASLHIATKGELISDRGRGHGSDDSYNDDRGRGRSSDDSYNDDRRRGGNDNPGRSSDDNSDRRRGSENRGTSSQLPDRVANAVLADLSKQTKLSARQLQVTQFSRQTWSNACLGLAKPGKSCTQAVVPGWRVVVSDGRQNWVYRTDSNGRVLRLEAQNTANSLNAY